MKITLLVFALFSVTCNGDSPTPILDAIITGAEKIRSRIQNVGSLFGKMGNRNHGNLNFGGLIEVQHGGHGQRYQPPPYNYVPKEEGEDQKTIIVIVENENEEYLPPHHPGPNHRPGFPHRPGYNKHRPHNGQWNNNHQNQPNYGQNYQNNGANNQVLNQNGSENADQNKQQNQGMPTTESNNEPAVDDGKNYNAHGHTEHDKKTKDSTDKPLRVPLNPNEYIYNGDKIEVNAPKRETDKSAKDVEEFPIDIRFSTD